MAATKTPYEAFDIAKKFVKNMPLESVGPQILDEINKRMWMAAPWRWTLGALPPITPLVNVTDYNIALPNNFLYIYDAILANAGKIVRHLECIGEINPTVNQIGQISKIAHVTAGTFRVYPKPPQVDNPASSILCRYKKVSPLVTNQSQSTPGLLVMDDDWFWVYQHGVIWLSYLWGDDSRAGSATVDKNGQTQYSGQRAVFEDGLWQMRNREKLIPLDDRKAIDVEENNK